MWNNLRRRRGDYGLRRSEMVLPSSAALLYLAVLLRDGPGAPSPSLTPDWKVVQVEGSRMKWQDESSSIEIRTQGQLADGTPALDEIVARCANVHVEQMSHNAWWIGLEAGGKNFHLNFNLEDGRLCVHLLLDADDETETAEWENDGRPRGRK
jgi:hypothetical protein